MSVHRSEPTARREEDPAATEAVYPADRFALRLWLACCAILWLPAVYRLTLNLGGLLR